MTVTTVVNIRSGKPYDIYIGRPSPYGNPYSHMDGTKAQFRVATREEAVRRYEDWLHDRLEEQPTFLDGLQGRRLGCFCAPALCHGDVIARFLDS